MGQKGETMLNLDELLGLATDSPVITDQEDLDKETGGSESEESSSD
jgi:hypothetical protein